MTGEWRAWLRIALLVAAIAPLAWWMQRAGQRADVPATAQEAELAQSLLRAARQTQATTPVQGMLTEREAQAIMAARAPSGAPLVERMALADGSALGLDAASRTFYCTLGSVGEAWPQAELLAAGGGGAIQIAPLQDWTAGACDDAVRSGARFELLAYTDDAYEIVGIVFTGLPIVSLHVGEGETLGDEYVPGWIDVSAAGHDAVHASMLVHLRGGGFPQKYPKESYRVELHEVTPGGRDSKLSIPLLDLEADTDFILVANTGDETRMKNHLCWQLWESWSATGYALCTLKSRMVEVFVDDEYVGLYQLLERVDAQEELEAMGFNPGTDAVFRAIREENIGKRPVSDVGDPIGVLFELRYAPEGTAAEDAFELLYTWVELNRTDDERMDNEAFRSAAREHIDVQAMMEYFLFMQAVSLGMDNVVNNLFVFAVQQRGVWRYYLAPWDMDMAFQKVNATSPDELNLWLACPVRMLELNSMGCRDILWDLWRAKRRTVLEDDALRKWIMGEEERINASGAYLRDSRKWTGEAKTLDLSALAEFAVEHMYTIHEYMSELWPQ